MPWELSPETLIFCPIPSSPRLGGLAQEAKEQGAKMKHLFQWEKDGWGPSVTLHRFWLSFPLSLFAPRSPHTLLHTCRCDLPAPNDTRKIQVRLVEKLEVSTSRAAGAHEVSLKAVEGLL